MLKFAILKGAAVTGLLILAPQAALAVVLAAPLLLAWALHRLDDRAAAPRFQSAPRPALPRRRAA